jgi:hypothetical protein
MSSTDNSSVLNPATLASSSYGIAGFPDFYEAQNAIAQNSVASDEQKQIRALDDPALSSFAASPLPELQQIALPFHSMVQWSASPDALNASLRAGCNGSTFIPFGRTSIGFHSATTRNKVQTVQLSQYGDPLAFGECLNLMRAFSGNNTQVTVNRLIPLFLSVRYDGDPTWIGNYGYNVTFRFFHGDTPYWRMETVPAGPVPDFVRKRLQTDNLSVIVVWSEKALGTITSSVLSSTGGILGLYSFILLTIGQWLASWTASFFVDLWLTRIVNPTKLLNVLLALEAYEMSDEPDKEFQLSELLLENLRTITRVVQMTNVRQEEA